jgi:hypothetical protein
MQAWLHRYRCTHRWEITLVRYIPAAERDGNIVYIRWLKPHIIRFSHQELVLSLLVQVRCILFRKMILWQGNSAKEFGTVKYSSLILHKRIVCRKFIDNCCYVLSFYIVLYIWYYFFINVGVRVSLRATDSEINDHVSFQWP